MSEVKEASKIKSLSKGNQQKVQLIATLIHEPKLMILDEPFSGLDPVNADLLKQGILELKAKGSSIIFSSHNMNNVEEICDHLVMIHYGKQVLSGTVDEVKESLVDPYFPRKSWLESSPTSSPVRRRKGPSPKRASLSFDTKRGVRRSRYLWRGDAREVYCPI